jgi:hypothetical protein
VDAPLRRLVLTTPAFFDIFTRRTIGAVSDDKVRTHWTRQFSRKTGW